MMPPVNGSRPKNDENDVIERNADYFVTTTTIKHTVTIERLMTILQARKTTGTLSLHFRKGGIRRIELNEKTQPSEDNCDRIREILKMD